jgi:hypothetical protein
LWVFQVSQNPVRILFSRQSILFLQPVSFIPCFFHMHCCMNGTILKEVLLLNGREEIVKNIFYIAVIILVSLSCQRAGKARSTSNGVSSVPYETPTYVQDRKLEYKSASETNFGGAEGAGTGSSYASKGLRSAALKDKQANPQKDSLANSRNLSRTSGRMVYTKIR